MQASNIFIVSCVLLFVIWWLQLQATAQCSRGILSWNMVQTALFLLLLLVRNIDLLSKKINAKTPKQSHSKNTVLPFMSYMP